MDQGRPLLFVFSLGHPQIGESIKACQNGSTNPTAIGFFNGAKNMRFHIIRLHGVDLYSRVLLY